MLLIISYIAYHFLPDICLYFALFTELLLLPYGSSNGDLEMLSNPDPESNFYPNQFISKDLSCGFHFPFGSKLYPQLYVSHLDILAVVKRARSLPTKFVVNFKLSCFINHLWVFHQIGYDDD